MSQEAQPFQANFKECDVCCLYSDKFISCLYCQASACEKCHQTFILDQFQDKCMFCAKTWNFEFMQKNFREGWLDKTYKDKKKVILFEREKAMLPATQEEMKIDEEKEKKDMKIKHLMKKLSFYRDSFKKVEKDKKMKSEHKMEELDAIIRASEKIQEKIRVLQDEKSVLEVMDPVAPKATHPCSKNECRGFLITEEKEYKCGICSTPHCKKCRCEKEEEHKCDPNTLETIKMMDKETKPCPKCSIPIYKISGCDQMYCTGCHTAFSWRTGRVETGHIHNPHYWEYLREQGRDVEELNRLHGQAPNPQANQNACLTINDVMAVAGGPSFEVTRILTNIREYELPKLTAQVNNKDVRVRYLTNEIDEKNFKMVLYKREKKHNFNTDLSQILNMVYDASQDVLVKMYRDSVIYPTLRRNTNSFEKQFHRDRDELLKICMYAIEEVEKLSSRYSYVVPVSVDRTLKELLLNL